MNLFYILLVFFLGYYIGILIRTYLKKKKNKTQNKYFYIYPFFFFERKINKYGKEFKNEKYYYLFLNENYCEENCNNNLKLICIGNGTHLFYLYNENRKKYFSYIQISFIKLFNLYIDDIKEFEISLYFVKNNNINNKLDLYLIEKKKFIKENYLSFGKFLFENNFKYNKFCIKINILLTFKKRFDDRKICLGEIMAKIK